ncbi:hypothetical protein LCI18_013046 [Fusarium solani-melongenae]|uniref:Uncharacterized protein n=1 Tax=Fusarium solani subsp. cucurbitae TaxID=2747967 RepID=A0ACD3ZMN9_FUSSC|nr:hypothetical protein LCI18_013046 [Fusarium solani-melongenae]
MKRCAITCTGRFQVNRLSAEAQKRWASWDRSDLTDEALTKQVESGLGHDAEGNPLKIDIKSKTVSTASGPLPISPVLDPRWMKAKRRPKKKDAGKISGQFRKKLSNNPFALALMTPMRRCNNSNTSLPRYFYQDFELVDNPDPKIEAGWWAPGPLTFENLEPFHDPNLSLPVAKRERYLTGSEEDVEEDFKKVVEEEGEEDVEEDAEEDAEEDIEDELPANGASLGSEAVTAEAQSSPAESDAVNRTTESETVESTSESAAVEGTSESTAIEGTSDSAAVEDTSSQERRPRRAPLTVYVLARKRAIEILSTPGQNHKYLSNLTSSRHGMAMLAKGERRIWREGMDYVLLKMMRREATNTLILRAQSSEPPVYKFIHPCEGWEDTNMLYRGGCVLWLPKTSQGKRSVYQTMDGDPKFGAEKVPVHDLLWLLGEKEVRRLREEAELFRSREVLVLKPWKSRAMRNLHLLLWKLQGYLADPKVLETDFASLGNIEAQSTTESEARRRTEPKARSWAETKAQPTAESETRSITESKARSWTESETRSSTEESKAWPTTKSEGKPKQKPKITW